MKVICNRGALLEALTVAGTVVASRTPKPALQCVKLSALEKSLTVAATDLEVAIRYLDHQVQIDDPGEALVPADKMRDHDVMKHDATRDPRLTGSLEEIDEVSR